MMTECKEVDRDVIEQAYGMEINYKALRIRLPCSYRSH